MPRATPFTPLPRAPLHPQLPRMKLGATRVGEGAFLLFLTLAAPDYHILCSKPKKHHSAMLQLGRLPSPAKGRTGETQQGAGACRHGGKRVEWCTRGGHRAQLHSALPAAVRPPASCWTGQKGHLLPANVFVFLVQLLIRLGLIAFGSVVGVWGGSVGVWLVVLDFFAFSLKSCDGNRSTVTLHAFSAPRWPKTQNLGTGSKVQPLSFPSHKQTAQHRERVIGEPACTMQ